MQELDPEYENNIRACRMYPNIRTKRYYSGEEHMAYVSTTVRIDGVTQHTGNVTAMIVPPAYNLPGPSVSDDDGYVVRLVTDVALSHIVMNVRYLMSQSC